MINQTEVKPNGFKQLSAKELDSVAGGYTYNSSYNTAQTYDNEIVVTGERYDNPLDDYYYYQGMYGNYTENYYYSYSMYYGALYNNYVVPAPEPDENPNEHDCEKAAVSTAAAGIADATLNDGVRDSSDRQDEYAVTIAGDAGKFITSEVQQGESYRDAAPDAPETPLDPPAGYTYADITAVVHSHPPSGDRDTDQRNRAPSDGDWLAADELVARGANADTLVLYIIDRWGTMRAFNYVSYEDRNASRSNPSGNQDSASDGTEVDPNDDSCS